MLKKLEFYYDEDHEKIDISDEKIYWDTQKNQFRHKFNCDECDKPLGCMCYDMLSSAIAGVNDGMLCDDCWFDYVSQDYTINELIGELDTKRIKKVYEYVESVIITEDEIKEYIEETEAEENQEKCEIDIDDKIEIIDSGDKSDDLRTFVVGLLTKSEKMDICYNCADGCVEGEACNL